MLEHDEDALSGPAQALLRSARGGEEPTRAEHARLTARLRERENAVASAARRPSTLHLRSRWRATLVAALVVTGSLGALANPGVRQSVEQSVRQWAAQLPWLTPSEPTSVAPAPNPRASAPSRVPPQTPSLNQAADALSQQVNTTNSAPPALEPPLLAPQPPSSPLSAAPASKPTAVATAVQPPQVPSVPTTRGAVHLNPSIDSELSLVTAARDALARNDHSAVQRLAQAHRARFTNGELAPEMSGIEALSDCRRGAGSSHAVSFLARYPNTILGPRLRSDCKLDVISVPSSASQRTQEATTHQ